MTRQDRQYKNIILPFLLKHVVLLSEIIIIYYQVLLFQKVKQKVKIICFDTRNSVEYYELL